MSNLLLYHFLIYILSLSSLGSASLVLLIFLSGTSASLKAFSYAYLASHASSFMIFTSLFPGIVGLPAFVSLKALAYLLTASQTGSVPGT